MGVFGRLVGALVDEAPEVGRLEGAPPAVEPDAGRTGRLSWLPLSLRSNQPNLKKCLALQFVGAAILFKCLEK